MNLKKLLKTFGMFALVTLAGVGMAHAAPGVDACALVTSMKGIFGTLKILAAAGAVFCIAGWGWGYIVKPEGATKDDIKDKGVGLLVGFTLLFGITMVLQFLPDIANCPGLKHGW